MTRYLQRWVDLQPRIEVRDRIGNIQKLANIGNGLTGVCTSSHPPSGSQRVLADIIGGEIEPESAPATIQ